MLPGGLIDPVAIRRFGLERQWTSQVQVSPLGDRVTHLELFDGVLYVQTSAALIQALDAESGKTLWTVHWGLPNHPSTAAAFSKDRVAVVNGSKVFVGARSDGTLEFDRSLAAAAADGISVGEKRVFVPTYKGRIESIEIKDPKKTPTHLRISGRPGRPLLTSKRLCLATTDNKLYLLDPKDPTEGARLDTSGVIEAPLAYRAPHVFAAANDGFVYAVDESTGDLHWRASAAAPIRKAPVIGQQDVFVVTDLGDLLSLSLADGQEQWTSPNIKNVVASTAKRVYAQDRFGRLVILDADSGRRLGGFMAQDIETVLPNSQNDRLYLVTAGGLVQCLRESDLPQPLVFAPPVAEEPAAEEETDAAAAKAAPAVPAAKPVAPPRRTAPAAARPKPQREERLDAGDRASRNRRARNRGDAPADGLPAAIEAGDDQPAGRRGRANRRNRGAADDAAAEEAPLDPAAGDAEMEAPADPE
jgi:outer membrane protein assembly factor BamB